MNDVNYGYLLKLQQKMSIEWQVFLLG